MNAEEHTGKCSAAVLSWNYSKQEWQWTNRQINRLKDKQVDRHEQNSTAHDTGDK